MGNLKDQAIELFTKHSEGLTFDILKRYLHTGTATTNKIIEQLENNNIISKPDIEYKRYLIK